MSESVKMVISDPAKFGLLATQVKLDLIQAALATVNIMAARGRKEAIKNMESQFIIRNNFTPRQVQFTPMPESKYVKLSAIHSTLGVTTKASYMERQEKGGERKPESGSRLSIPMDTARGGNRRSPVAKKNYLKSLKKKIVYANFHYGKSNDQRSPGTKLVAAAYVAAKKRKLLRYSAGLFEVTQFSKNGYSVSFDLDMMYLFDKQKTFTPENKWLLPASEKMAAQVISIFSAQMKKLEKK